MISGFGGSGTGWTVNSTGIASTPITGDVLTLTDNGLNEGRNAFDNTPESMGVGNQGFSRQVSVYTPSANKAANGAAFILQNDPRGAAATSGSGGSLGYSAITPSAAIELNIYNNATGGIGTALGTNGSTPTYSSVAPVSLGGGDPIQVTVSYDPADSILTETLLDTSTLATFTKSYTGVVATKQLGEQHGVHRLQRFGPAAARRPRQNDQGNFQLLGTGSRLRQ